jgi:tetratricopeptide (TPR) repeat protein
MTTSDRSPALPTSLPSPEATEALRLSEEKFAKAFRISPDAILISSFVDGRIIDANDSFFRITGYTREEVIGHLTEELGVWRNMDDRAALLAELQANRPVVVLENLGIAALPVWHFAVVVGYSKEDDSLLLRSGRSKRQFMSAYNFLRTWGAAGKWAVVVLRPGQLPASDDPDGYLRAVAAKESVTGPAGLVEAYRAAVLRWPDNAVARFGYANALQASGQLRAAVEQYRALVAQRPRQVAALNNLADALNQQGCRAEALAIIERAQSTAPEAEPLRGVLEQTRHEILSATTAGGPEPELCTE